MGTETGTGIRMLLLGVYGMEVVECGGALAINAENGGQSFASIMLSRDDTRGQVKQAAEVLGVSMYFPEFQLGYVDVSVEAKKKLVRIIREVKPDVIITQDPVHSYRDLDPDRRQAMILILESIALAGRNFALDEMPELQPHRIPTIYYMTPETPNCVVNVAHVWDKKTAAMDKLHSQMEFSAQHYIDTIGLEGLEKIYPGFSSLATHYEQGRAIRKIEDQAVHVYHGLATHGHFSLAEPYRREGNFHLQTLIK
jgi:LmbE family N-acetylglucosaminyl deacetylase